MQVYTIKLRVDQAWLQAIQKMTNDVYEGEVCDWLEVVEVEPKEKVMSTCTWCGDTYESTGIWGETHRCKEDENDKAP